MPAPIVITITSQAAGAIAPIERVTKAVDGMAARLTGLNGMLGGLAGKLAAVFTVGAIAGAVKNAVNVADAAGKLAQKTGVAVEALSALQYAAELADVETGELQVGLKTLAQQISGAASGSKQAQDAFSQLGVEFANQDGSLRSVDGVLLSLADRFAAMPDGVAKTDLAVQLFGRSGTALIPLLNEGSEGIKEMTDEAERLNLVITQEMATRADNFNDTVTRMGAAFQGVALNLASALLPSMEAFASMAQSASENTGLLKGVIEDLGEALRFVAYLLNKITGGWKMLWVIIAQGGKSAMAALKMDFDAAAREIEAMKDRLADVQAETAARSALITGEYTAQPGRKRSAPTAKAPAPGASGPFFSPPGAESLPSVPQLNAMKQGLLELGEAWGDLGNNAARGALSTIRTAVDSVSDSITDVIMGTKSWAEALRQIGVTILGSVVNAITRMFAEWVAGLIAKSVVTRSTAAADAAAQAPSALMTSISSFGVAAAIGGAMFLAAMALSGGFERGGYTGGRKGAPAGVVHGEEYVFSAPAVKNAGVGFLDSLHGALQGAQALPGGMAAAMSSRLGAAPSPRGATSPSPRSGSSPVNVVMVDRRQDLRDVVVREGSRHFIRDLQRRGNRIQV